MKKIFILLFIPFAIACGGSSTENKTDSTAGDQTSGDQNANSESANIPEGISKADYENGLNMIATSDCLTCHEISSTKTGPAYKDVAAKYENSDANVEMLAHKIIKGGSGNWGQVPMTPHDSLSLDNAKVMVKYILSLKNAK